MKALLLISLIVTTGIAIADGACMLGGMEVPGFAVRSLDSARFQALHAAAAPSGEGERWAEIPWHTDLNAARQQAVREGKPLFMWIMDGHPLGCT